MQPRRLRCLWGNSNIPVFSHLLWNDVDPCCSGAFMLSELGNVSWSQINQSKIMWEMEFLWESFEVAILVYVVLSSLGFCCCDKILWAKSTRGNKGLSQLTVHIRVHPQRKSGQEVKAGTDAEASEECTLLICLLSLLSYSIQDQPSRCCTVICAMGPPSSITNQENDPQGNLQREFFSTEVPLSQMTVACVRLT